MPMDVDTSKLREIWTIIASAFGFLLGIAGAGAMVQKVKGDIRSIKNAVMDDKGNPIIITRAECDKKRRECGVDRHDRRTESREDLHRELQNIHAAITAQNVQFKSLAEETARLGGVITLLSKNISIRMDNDREGGHG
jgi:hypothetical protein